MNKKIIQEVKNFVETECKKPTSKYGYEPYPFHFVPVVNYAQKLAKELGGDLEIVTIASYLHDIGSIIYGRENHHLTGAKIAEKKLQELNYPKEKIEKVKNCILHHRGSKNYQRLSIEEQIVVEADCLSAFDNLSGILKAAFICENLDQGQAKISARTKLENKWKQLKFKNSKIIIKPKFEAAMLLLK
ncbi:MAG: HD domain-containing protein [Patescibacteria group bacterium]|jgi:uncharacterized protein